MMQETKGILYTIKETIFEFLHYDLPIESGMLLPSSFVFYPRGIKFPTFSLT